MSGYGFFFECGPTNSGCIYPHNLNHAMENRTLTQNRGRFRGAGQWMTTIVTLALYLRYLTYCLLRGSQAPKEVTTVDCS
jgi:hypothetical protein